MVRLYSAHFGNRTRCQPRGILHEDVQGPRKKPPAAGSGCAGAILAALRTAGRRLTRSELTAALNAQEPGLPRHPITVRSTLEKLLKRGLIHARLQVGGQVAYGLPG